jgi:hypothetical protein
MKDSLLRPLLFYCANKDILTRRKTFESQFRSSFKSLFSDYDASNIADLFDRGYINLRHAIHKQELRELLSIYKYSVMFSISNWNYGSNILDYKNYASKATCYCTHPLLTNFLLERIEKILKRNRIFPPIDYRIDNISFMLTPNTVSAASNYWHKDAAGHAIRLFFILKVYGPTPTTQVIGRSNMLPTYGIHLDSIRALYPYINHLKAHLQPYTTEYFEGLIMHSLSDNISENITTLNQEIGSIAGWDFNTFHKAVIPADSGIYSTGYRLALVVDLMDRRCSDYVTELNLAPCGPGQVPIYFDSYPTSSLIDQKHIHKTTPQGFLYCTRARMESILQNCKFNADPSL